MRGIWTIVLSNFGGVAWQCENEYHDRSDECSTGARRKIIYSGDYCSSTIMIDGYHASMVAYLSSTLWIKDILFHTPFNPSHVRPHVPLSSEAFLMDLKVSHNQKTLTIDPFCIAKVFP